jgi:rhomboid protease GluP
VTEAARTAAGRSVTAAVVSMTALVTGASLVFPGVLLFLQRSPAAVAGEAWRFVTPLFVERGGWGEIGFNLVSLAIVGILVERVCGRGRWVIVYLVGGITGEAVGLVWRPIGAGSSVAVCGLLGAWALWAMMRRRSWLRVAAALLVMVAGVALVGMHNLHGPPVLAGACAAAIVARGMQ